MSRIREHIEQLEYRLDKGDLSFLDRRLLLRKAFEAVCEDAYREGRTEGMADVHAAQHAEREAERLAAASEEADCG